PPCTGMPPANAGSPPAGPGPGLHCLAALASTKTCGTAGWCAVRVRRVAFDRRAPRLRGGVPRAVTLVTASGVAVRAAHGIRHLAVARRGVRAAAKQTCAVLTMRYFEHSVTRWDAFPG